MSGWQRPDDAATRYAPLPPGLAVPGLGRRIGAWVIDNLILGTLGIAVLTVAFVAGAVAVNPAALDQYPLGVGSYPTVPLLVVHEPGMILFGIVSVATGLVYAVGGWMFLRGTPGQRMLGLEVGEARGGGNLGLWRSLLRWLALYGVPNATSAAFMVAMFHILATVPADQLTGPNADPYSALPSSLATWADVTNAAWLAGLLWQLALMISAAVGARGRAVHDRLAGSLVVEKVPVLAPQPWTAQWPAWSGAAPWPGYGPASTGGSPSASGQWAPPLEWPAEWPPPPAAPGPWPPGSSPAPGSLPAPGAPGSPGSSPVPGTPGSANPPGASPSAAPEGPPPPSETGGPPGGAPAPPAGPPPPPGGFLWGGADAPTRLASAPRPYLGSGRYSLPAGLQIASVGRRAGAYLIDSVIVFVVWTVIFTAVGMLGYETTFPEAATSVPRGVLVAGVLGGIAQIVYFVPSWALRRSTPAQRLLRLQVASARSGKRLAWSDAFIRWGILQGPFALYSALPAPFNYFAFLFAVVWMPVLYVSTTNDQDRRGIHDRAVDSLVVHGA